MKRFFKVSFPALLVLGAILGVAYYTGVVSFRKFPVASGAKQITLNCNYHGQVVAIQETLYKSIDDYYASEPKKKAYTLGNKYGSFVFNYKEDGVIKDLTQKVKAKGLEMGLSDDQTMDLATCFIQNIPYDKEKGKTVLAQSPVNKISPNDFNATLGRFPYETLYDNKGICTDKSYLESAILKELGYGTSLLTFDSEKHMAVGVKTPQGFTSFNTEYSYLETTNVGFKVGQIPAVDKNSGGAKNPELNKVVGVSGTKAADSLIQEMPDSGFNAPSEIYKVYDGKEYMRIIEITKTLNRIKEIIPEINAANNEIVGIKEGLVKEEAQVEAAKAETGSYEAKLTEAKSAYEASGTSSSYASYERAHDSYLSSYNKTKGEIDNYNYQIRGLNAKVVALNTLIEEYNQLVKSD